MKKVPLLDATNGQEYVINGESTELVPQDHSVYIDRHGNTYDPYQAKVTLDQLPADGVIELPRTTWWRT